MKSCVLTASDLGGVCVLQKLGLLVMELKQTLGLGLNKAKGRSLRR